MEAEKKKKGFLAVIWESLTRTGGCCGGGQSCCGPCDEETDKSVTGENQGDEKRTK